ncbi:MAG: DUF1844 domain-containing protein [Candidatus Omnitrophica bacterium]|nr:DUF1844 domain-containing protein [Candidatus Omnitrophota bacterium]MBI3009610.1 DUF1844 domain-containing protein [Candidatus Omnitrophota bacterium]
MSDSERKRVDESWKERVEQEKQVDPATETKPSSSQLSEEPSKKSGGRSAAAPMEARFDLLVSSLAMEAFVALGDLPHPSTQKQATNLPHARYLIDLLGILDEKTKSNLTADEEHLMKDSLYQLRMRYLAKTQPSAS